MWRGFVARTILCTKGELTAELPPVRSSSGSAGREAGSVLDVQLCTLLIATLPSTAADGPTEAVATEAVATGAEGGNWARLRERERARTRAVSEGAGRAER